MNRIGDVAFFHIFICSNRPVRLAFGCYPPILGSFLTRPPLVTKMLLPIFTATDRTSRLYNL